MLPDKDVIIIHGAPGIGKTSVSQALHQRLNSPWFEFGWIPEFRQKGEVTISYEEEEQLSFENLCLVVNNYLRHGFRGVILSDLRDPIVAQALWRFARRDLLLVTLVTTDEELLKSRVLDDTRSSGYRDWNEALALNRQYRERPMYRREMRIDIGGQSVENIVDKIIESVSPTGA
jgi:broad-specificity NMP kinase